MVSQQKVVWRSLVDVNRVKAAINVLKSSNWLYKDVNNESVDEATKHIIEVSNTATTRMLEKASKLDFRPTQSEI